MLSRYLHLVSMTQNKASGNLLSSLLESYYGRVRWRDDFHRVRRRFWLLYWCFHDFYETLVGVVGLSIRVLRQGLSYRPRTRSGGLHLLGRALSGCPPGAFSRNGACRRSVQILFTIRCLPDLRIREVDDDRLLRRLLQVRRFFYWFPPQVLRQWRR